MIWKIFTNSAGILVSRILGFIRDLLTASILGANIYSDIFFVAFKLPNLFRRIFAEGAFTQAFLPTYTSSRLKSLFAIAVFKRFFLIIFTFSLLVTLFPSFFTKVIALGFSKELIELASPYVAINFYYLDLIFCVTFIAALLQYREHFATTAFATALLNLSLIFALLLFKHSSKEEIVLAMSWAVIVGGVLQLLLHLLVLHKKRGLKPLLIAFHHNTQKVKEDLQRFYKNFFPAIWGNSTAQISAFVDTWLASFLTAGAISYLYYSNRILQLPLALFAIATATALFPSISKAISKGEEEKALKLFKKSFWFLLILLTLATLGGVLLSKEIIAFLFERGSFDRIDTLYTAETLRMYIIGLLPYGLSKLFLLWLFASHKQKLAAKIATYSLFTNLFFSSILIFPLETAGLALASSLAGITQLLLLLKEFKDKLRFLWSLKLALILFLLTVVEVGVILGIKKIIDPFFGL
ncbi:MAG: murein biosynthesis integral membrane protein MurJ [Epsilonproteobacteria bacterium]|nr:murein biosynthesis integral membrane protein MurJ [Campylobacterota bacterium]